MGTVARKLARVFAVGMFLAVVAIVALSIVAASATAHVGQNNPAAYHVAQAFYRHVSNDVYTQVYSDLSNGGHGQAAGAMRHAANDLCAGTLYEDFSCGEGYVTAEDGSQVPESFYSETDYRPVKAAQGH